MTDPVTEQQIDRDHLRENAVEGGAWGAVVLVLLDQLEQAEAELDSWMTRAYDSEQREWEAETRLTGWMEHWNATARTGAVDEVVAILEANARADQAEARIKAVEDVLDAWDRFEHHDSLEVGIRRALDLPYLGSPDECCGRDICALGQGHSGPCRC